MIQKNTDVISSGSPSGGGRSGPFLAKIVSHLDPTYMGMLEVQILRPVGNDPVAQGQLHQVRMMSPFYGSTGIDYVAKDPNDYNNTQKSYGMWFVPPDVGTTVVIIFIDGDPKKGYWIGCVPDEGMNFMIPGIAATEYVTEGKGRVPVAEYNKKASQPAQDSTKIKKPKHPIAATLEAQGLLLDDSRGITTSSARREVPSQVFGISTPGPVDKQSGAKRGPVGKKETEIPNAFVSRLGGSTFVMDDGDDKFIRKTPAGGEKAGPPEYVAVEQGEKGGSVTIPHNELVRIRTRTGHQILLHNSEDLIYIGNASGTSWIELTSNGKIDIYAGDSISVHTGADLNFFADRDINFEAGRNINMKSTKDFHLESAETFAVVAKTDGKITILEKSLQIHAKENVLITAEKNTEINSGGNHLETASIIHMNGPTAAKAEAAKILKTHTLPNNEGKDGVKSIMRRLPTHEPYPQHENLDPAAYIPKHTDRDVDERYEKNSETIKKPAEKWKQYTTKTDTFSKVKPPEKKK